GCLKQHCHSTNLQTISIGLRIRFLARYQKSVTDASPILSDDDFVKKKDMIIGVINRYLH
ncbi:MAG TPA: hypothetical protein VF903_05630, partial [Nitrospirota bacterium]